MSTFVCFNNLLFVDVGGWRPKLTTAWVFQLESLRRSASGRSLTGNTADGRTRQLWLWLSSCGRPSQGSMATAKTKMN
jgi:hypothetical protein